MKNSSNESIGKRVAQMRKQRSLSQADLANAISSSNKHISEIERGVTGISIDTQVLLAHKLHCSLDYLIQGEEFKSVDSLLPPPILEILLSGNQEEIDRLNRYLQMYIELTKNGKQD